MTATPHAATRQRDLLLTYVRPQKGRVALLAALLFGNLGLQLTGPLILRAFIDAAIARRSLDTLIGAGVLFLVVALVTQSVAVAETYVAESVGWTATNQLREDLALHLLRLDMAFHNRRTPGEMIERVDGDITALANFFSRFVLLIVGNLALLCGVLVMLFREDARVGGGMTAFAVCALFVLSRSRRIGVTASGEERQASAELFGFIEERLAGLDDIRANGGNSYALRRLRQFQRAWFDKSLTAWLRRAVMILISVGLWMLGYALALGLGAALFEAGAVSLGTVYLFLAYTDTLRRPLDQITQQMQDLQKAAASVARIGELYMYATRIADGPGAPLPGGPLSVEFESVTFGYGPESPTLQDVSFQIAPGATLGVVGRTGSGKTTLSRLLLRLYEPQAGVIRLGGVDLRALALPDLRGHIGVVTQDVQLFRASVRDNLTLFDPAISDDRILETLRDLGLDGWYRLLPEGLDSELEAGGGGLSAGQAQLLAFARVFLRDPGLVILDEASSRLDPATERLIERAVDRLLRDRTAIIIAHRLGTVQRADAILVLDEGCVREYGPRERLAADPDSHFYRLLQTGLEEART
jgi:ATP-binding cassette, subfamily B, bacterial